MDGEHTINGLVRKRAEIAGKIEHLETTVRQLAIDLEAVDAVLRIFDPDIQLEAIKPKPMPPRQQAYKGELTRIVLAALRSKGPMTAHELAVLAMGERKLPMTDKRLAIAMHKRTMACLRHLRVRGVLVPEKRAKGDQLWNLT